MQKEAQSNIDSHCVTTETSTDRGDSMGWNKDIVRDIHPDDVLMGRGVARNEHTGNVRYREIVAYYKEEYLATTRRAQKNKIARKVIKEVESTGGRFLRDCCHSRGDRNLFVIEERAIVLEKVKQALRFLGRDNKDQVPETPGQSSAPPAISSPSFGEKSESRPPSLAGERPLQPSEPPSVFTVSQPSETALSAPNHTQNHSSLIQALLHERNMLNEIRTLEQSELHQQRVPNTSSRVVPASNPSPLTHGIEQSIPGIYLLPTLTNPEKSISA